MEEFIREGGKAVGYVRVSTRSQGDSGVGLAWQAEEIMAAAHNFGYLVEQVFEDTHTGRGKRSALQRPGLQDTLEVARREAVPIIVTGIDRLSRDAKTLEDLFLEGLITVLVAKDGRLVDYKFDKVAAAIEQKRGDLISRRTKEALARKKAAGVKLGNPASLPDATRNSRKMRSLRSAEVVRKIADFLAKNPQLASQSVPALVKALNDAKIRTGWGREWTPTALRTPLKAAREELSVRADLDDDGDLSEGMGLADAGVQQVDEDTAANEIRDHYKTVEGFGRF